MKYKDIKSPNDLLMFMKENFLYGYIDKNGKKHYPEDKDFNLYWYDNYSLSSFDDVINNKIGNCWDLVEFERKWFLDNGYEVNTFYEMVVLDYNNNYPTHSFLTYKDNNKYYWFEYADLANIGIHEFNSEKELIDYQITKYISFLKNEFNIKEKELSKIRLYNFLKTTEKLSAREYIDFVTSGKSIKNSVVDK